MAIVEESNLDFFLNKISGVGQHTHRTRYLGQGYKFNDPYTVYLKAQSLHQLDLQKRRKRKLA